MKKSGKKISIMIINWVLLTTGVIIFLVGCLPYSELIGITYEMPPYEDIEIPIYRYVPFNIVFLITGVILISISSLIFYLIKEKK